MHVRLTSMTFPVIWSSVLILVTREWRYCGLVYKFFLISYIEVKSSFVRCRKYHKSWWRCRASHLGRFTLWHNGCRATQLGRFTLWHNGRRTKPGLMHAPGADIFQRQWRTMLKIWKLIIKVKFNSKLLKDGGFGRFSKHRSMNALRRQNIRPQQTFERWTPKTQESPRELASQSETKRKQAPQSEANVCRQRKCNLKKSSLINCTGHPIMQRTPNTN